MGTGKTAVGQLAAKMLGLSFLDSDLEIEKKYRTSISQVFKTDGEIGFRKMEKDFIQSGHPKSGCLISCGGGLPIAEGMIEMLKNNGKVFTLWASPRQFLNVSKKNSSRPLLQTEDPFSKITELVVRKRAKIQEWRTRLSQPMVDLLEGRRPYPKKLSRRIELVIKKGPGNLGKSFWWADHPTLLRYKSMLS